MHKCKLVTSFPFISTEALRLSDATLTDFSTCYKDSKRSFPVEVPCGFTLARLCRRFFKKLKKSSLPHPRVVEKAYDFLSSIKHKTRCSAECFHQKKIFISLSCHIIMMIINFILFLKVIHFTFLCHLHCF